MSTVGAVDVCIVVFWPSKAADLTAVLRICFVVAMRYIRLTAAQSSEAVSSGLSLLSSTQLL
jgi:hypothetical protein